LYCQLSDNARRGTIFLSAKRAEVISSDSRSFGIVA
jgi:hypothetical protein